MISITLPSVKKKSLPDFLKATLKQGEM